MLKAEFAGEIDVGGPDLARSLTALGLIDEYRLYLHPVVLGRGKPFFACTRWPDCTFIMNKKPENQEELEAAFREWKINPPKPKPIKKKKEY